MRRLALLLFLTACEGKVGDHTLPPPPVLPIVPDTRDSGASPDGGGDSPDASSPDDAGTTDAGSTPDAGAPCSTVTCGAGAHCVPNPDRCVCDPGYFPDAGACLPGDPGIPSQRTKAQVCAGWALGNMATDPNPFSKTTATCDPGTLTRAGIDDALARLNALRWLAGLGPTTDDATDDDAAQKCALMSAWNPAGPGAHNPPTTSTCYTPEGAGAAGSSNIAWGCGSPQGAIDQWFVDFGNETTMGHRRWLLAPPLDPVGFGFYVGGNNYGSASCIRVFGGSGTGPSPQWFSFPPAGYSPVEVAQWTWSVHGNALGSGTNFAATITRMSDGASLANTVAVMQGSYGYLPAITITHDGWQPAAGETYHVKVTATNAGPFEYDVSPVTCP